MAVSIRNMRRGVAAGGVALVLVVAVFLGIARLKGIHFHLDLPGRLGVDISQTANGFTYSQSQKGHTLFTIHASKLVQYKGDQAELHDVTITLYGPEGSGRSDKIYGETFLYDRKQGIARATGPVRIDFASPEGKLEAPGQGGAASQTGQPAGTIHVVTSGVVFNQATGEASTDQHVEFELSRATGSSTGAQYNEKSGVLVLNSQVVLTTTAEAGEKPGSGATTTVQAAHAQLLRDTHQAYLLQDRADSSGRHTVSDEATINFRQDGTAERIEERGHVRITTDSGAQVQSPDAVIDLDAQSRPLVANLDGGITYYSNDGVRTMQGSAISGTLKFAPAPGAVPGSAKEQSPSPQQQLHHAQFRDAVTFLLQQHSLHGDPNGSVTRQLSGSTVDIEFAPLAGPGQGGRAEAQHILAQGAATVVLHDVPSKGPSQSTTISGAQLLATLVDGHELKSLDGKGSTKIAQSSTDGASSTSTGDTLHVTFAPPKAAAGPGGSADQSAGVDTAVQTGNVEIVQTPAPPVSNETKGAKDVGSAKDASAPSPLHATAQRAEYDAANQMLHLSGAPHLRNDTLDLVADTVDYHRDNGDASAMGDVKATYEQQSGRKGPALGGEGPVHVTADHAQLTRYNNISIFYGAGSSLARMWQGGDAVSSPVLELDRDQQTLDAHGGRGDRGPVVHATLGAKSANPAGKPGDTRQNDTRHNDTRQDAAPTRLTSVSLHYAGNDHLAQFRGAVTAEQPAGTVHADQVEVYLTPGGPAAGSGASASRLDHLVATGHVVIVQPGRRGTGERLVYTAADGRYVLTGGPGQPPRIVDSQKGTTTGVALIFKSADDSVEVSSHPDSSGIAPHAGSDPQARTVTDTHTPN